VAVTRPFADATSRVQVGVAVRQEFVPHPTSTLPGAGVATSVAVRVGECSEQVVVPVPLLVHALLGPVRPWSDTVPAPPLTSTRASKSKRAPTTYAGLPDVRNGTVRVQVVAVPAAEHPSVHPWNPPGSWGVAVKVTVEPSGATAEHWKFAGTPVHVSSRPALSANAVATLPDPVQFRLRFTSSGSETRTVPPAAGAVKLHDVLDEVQSPDHAPAKLGMERLESASVTGAPVAYTASQVPEIAPVTGAIVQSMRSSVDWTRPPPVKPAAGRTLTVPMSAKLTGTLTPAPVAAKVQGPETGTFAQGPPHGRRDAGGRLQGERHVRARVDEALARRRALVGRERAEGGPVEAHRPRARAADADRSAAPAGRRKRTPTLVAVRTTIVQRGPAVPAQAPPHEPKVLLASGPASSTSVAPTCTSPSQAPVALAPAIVHAMGGCDGPPDTPPPPVVLASPVTVTRTAPGTNVAPTDPSAVSVSVHPGDAALAAQAPLHVPNCDPVAGAADTDTGRPTSTDSVQLCAPAPAASAQLCPAADTVPAPAPLSDTVSATCRRVNVAPTSRTRSGVTVHVPVPLHAPVHPAKVLFASGVAVSVIGAPALAVAAQTPVLASLRRTHEIGPPLTVPSPVPPTPTVTGCGRAKRALTPPVVGPTVMVHVAAVVPSHAPPQPRKASGAVAPAVKVTLVPSANVAEHVPLGSGPKRQAIPPGTLPTSPEPSPPLETDTPRSGTKVARAVRAWSAVSVQRSAAPAAAHASPHPPNADPACRTACSVTGASPGKAKLHAPCATPPVMRQSIPAGVESTVPFPAPAAATVITDARGTTV
jgi:hypothetical protein